MILTAGLQISRLPSGTWFAKKYQALQLKRWKISYIITEMQICLVYIKRGLYQSTKEWVCPNRSCYNVLISVKTDFDPGKRNFCVSFLLAFGLDLEFWLFGLFNRISDLNTCTSSCCWFLAQAFYGNFVKVLYIIKCQPVLYPLCKISGWSAWKQRSYYLSHYVIIITRRYDITPFWFCVYVLELFIFTHNKHFW